MQNFKTDNQGKIFYNSFTGEQFIGYSESAYNELQQIANEALSKAEKYKQMLIDNGLLQEPMGQDEINNQILETLQNLSSQIKKLNVNYSLPQTQQADKMPVEEVTEKEKEEHYKIQAMHDLILEIYDKFYKEVAMMIKMLKTPTH